MKKITPILILLILTNYSYGQNGLIKDIDYDGLNDTVFVDFKTSTIVCKLSTFNYKSISSKPFEIFNESSRIRETKNGFEFCNDWMRSGYKIQFRYNSKTQKIQLIGMSRYELGNAAHEGSGESSINVLTENYIGNWNHYDMEKDSFIKMPTIKTKIKVEIINIEDFSDEIYFKYAEKCAELYHKQSNSVSNRN